MEGREKRKGEKEREKEGREVDEGEALAEKGDGGWPWRWLEKKKRLEWAGLEANKQTNRIKHDQKTHVVGQPPGSSQYYSILVQSSLQPPPQ